MTPTPSDAAVAQKFRKRPVVIEAKQWFKQGDHPKVERYLDTAEGIEPLTADMQIAWGKFAKEFPGIQTLEGVMRVTPGDWIITGVKGEHYPCKPDIFAMTYEPEIEALRNRELDAGGGDFVLVPREPTSAMVNAARGLVNTRAGYAAMLAAAPQPTTPPAAEGGFDMLAHLRRQREWSERTFGPGSRTQGVVDHIRKELLEILADPSDVSEWIDVVILALDGAWRAGASPETIVHSIVAKQTKNEGRTWPDWRTIDPNKAIEHDRTGEG